MFGYGFLAVVLVLYLAAVGLDPLAVGIVLTLTLIGDTIISLWLTTHADRLGRRRVLVAGAALMVLAGVVFAFTSLAAAADPGRRHRRHLADRQRGRAVPGHRAGRPDPDRPGPPPDRDVRLVQPRRLRRDRDRRARRRPAQPGPHRRRNGAGRRLSRDRHRLRGDRPRDGRSGFWRLGAGHRGAAGRGRRPTASGAGSGSADRRASCCKLSVLFSLDAFGGGFIPQSLMAYWFHIQFGVDPALLG